MTNAQMDHYVARACEQWREYHPISGQDRNLPLRDPADPPGVYIVPETGLFLKGENIALSVQTPILAPYSAVGTKLVPALFFHHHEFFELNYVVRGSATNHIENEVYAQGEGEVTLFMPRAIHAPQLAGENPLLFNILIRPDWARQVFADLLSFSPGLFNFFLDALYGIDKARPYLMFDATPRVTRLVEEMIIEYYEHDAFYQQVLLAKLMELFTELARQRTKAQAAEPTREEKAADLTTILSFMRAHCTALTLEELASEFHFSPGHLSRLIQSGTGQSFRSHLAQMKLEKACQYLEHSDLPIETISQIAGYSDSSYFARVFRKQYEMSPKAYRSKMRS